ncbi:unnamed protein product [Moneuplotes crassus]|uniref:DAGKc domain-containing protein n=1 Tax=Euplotes crassus TaxID=5936 RepID=A0AAD1U2W0_EUPCR|nr:unnamed protein product [Moneuplotes crassus]
MGGTQTYVTEYQQLDRACLGLGRQDEETAYYFFNEAHGLFKIPRDEYENLRKAYSNDRTKKLKLPLKIICKYRELVMPEFDDNMNEAKIHYLTEGAIHPVDNYSFNFLLEQDYEYAKENLEGLTKLRYGERKRNIAILINPISGKQEAYNIYKTKLRPLLKATRMNYKVYKTDGPDFVDRWVSKLKFKQRTYDEIQETNKEGENESSLICEYTDIVIIGGDGLLALYLNSCYKHHFFDTLIKIPICILPGGTGNALAMDLGGNNIFDLCMNFLRCETIEGDIIRADFEDSKKSILCTALSWGFPSKVIESSSDWRGCLGASRYTACGAKEVLCAGGPWNMRSHHLTKVEHNPGLPDDITRTLISKRKIEEDKETDEENLKEQAAVPIIESEEIKSDKSCYTSNLSYKLVKTDSMKGHNIYKGEFDIKQDQICESDDENIERMSQLGAIINQKDEIDWENIDLKQVSVMVLTTHECRRSGTKDIFAPFSRINDGKMFLCGFKECSKVEMLMMMAKVSAGHGNQVKMSKYFHQEVKQIRIHPRADTSFNIDGEIYESENVIVTCLPKMINLFGKPYDLE